MRLLCLWDMPFHGSGLSTLGQSVSYGLKALGHEVIDLSLFDANSIDQFCQKQKFDCVLGIGYWSDAQRQISIPKKYHQKVCVYWVSEGCVPKFIDIIPKADLLLTISNYCKGIFEKYVPDCKPKLIYPGIDTEKFKPLPKPENTKIFTSFVSSGAVKGIDEALEACAILKKKNVEFTFVVHNPHTQYSLEYEYMQHLKQKAKKLDLLKNVFFDTTLPSEKLPEIYNTLAFYLAPMRMAGFGLPIAEAGACGVPTVGGNWKPISEQIIDHFNGCLFRGMPKMVDKELEGCKFSEEWQFGDPTDMAEKMEELLLSQPERYSFGVNACAHVEKNFNLKTQIKKLEEELMKIG